MFSKDSLIDAVLRGVIGANSYYERISSGFWLSEAGVENVIQYKVSESVFRLVKEYGFSVHLELPMREFLAISGVPTTGPVPRLLDGSKRIDVVILNEAGKPVVPIEIKRGISGDGLGTDAGRISKLVERASTAKGGAAKYGLICGFVAGSGTDRESAIRNLTQKISTAKENVSELVTSKYSVSAVFNSRTSSPSQFELVDGATKWWAAGAVCVYIRYRDSGD